MKKTLAEELRSYANVLTEAKLTPNQRQAFIDNINKQYMRIYELGDSGLDYLDGHKLKPPNMVMQHVYDDTLENVSDLGLGILSARLEEIANDAEMDIDDELGF